MKKSYDQYTVLVVGAGVMGRGIAQVFAARGLTVYMSDLEQRYLDGALEQIDRAIGVLEANGLAGADYRQAVKANLRPITNDQIPDVGPEVDCVFEAIYENEEAKRALYRTLNASCRPDCLFASNTSGMDIFSVCDGVIDCPGRLVIAHWFNPPHLMKLIEVVRGPHTSAETAEQLRGLLAFAGKKPAVLNHFVPGFIVNRLATVMNRELYYMIDQGWITAEDAENAIRYTDGLRFGFEGPIALWDFVGLEIPVTVAKGVLPSLCADTDTIPLAEKMIAQGKTGVRAGQGLLKYPDPEKYAVKRSRRIIQMTRVLEQFDREDEEDE